MTGSVHIACRDKDKDKDVSKLTCDCEQLWCQPVLYVAWLLFENYNKKPS